jgi:hypothetical protein
MTKRIYKNKEERNENRVFDDRHELLNLYASKCCNCKHFQKWDFFCAAFPDGIPDKYLSAEMAHVQVDSDQIGETVFTEP